MMFAETLSDAERRKQRFNAIGSTLLGCIGEQFVDTNVLLILYLTLLGGSSSVSMFSTATSSVAYSILLIPCAGIANRIGLKKTVRTSCLIACGAFLLMALAPFLPIGKNVICWIIIGGCFLFGLTRPLYLSTWYPLLDNFLRPEDRGMFFSNMRSTYMIFNVLLMGGLALVMGKNTPLWVCQLAFAVAGITQLGRNYFMQKFPVDPAQAKESYNLRKALNTSIHNSPLVCFSIYQCILNLAIASAVPVTYIYMKSSGRFPDNSVMIATISGMAGSIIGYLVIGRFIKRFGPCVTEITIHLGYILVLGILFFITNTHSSLILFCAAIFLTSVVVAFRSVATSSEMLALARPGNKTMALAFASVFQNVGTTCGRLGTTFILAGGMLADSWVMHGHTFLSYQTLHLLYFAIAVFSLFLLICQPAVIRQKED